MNLEKNKLKDFLPEQKEKNYTPVNYCIYCGILNNLSDEHNLIIFVTPKGGYSGGPVISKSGHVIGVITESLSKDNDDHESGFLTVISV
ncbi:MAG: hypothetical protein V1491_00710 [archaeon]